MKFEKPVNLSFSIEVFCCHISWAGTESREYKKNDDSYFFFGTGINIEWGEEFSDAFKPPIFIPAFKPMVMAFLVRAWIELFG